MEIYRVSFIGHRRVEDLRNVEKKLTEKLTELVCTKEFVEFYIGRDGEFDEIAAACIKRIQKIYGSCNSAITLVLPYSKVDIPYYEKYYDSIFIPDEVSKVHFKAAITKRNHWLIDHSDLLIGYIRKESGGAFDTVKYAKKKGVEILYV